MNDKEYIAFLEFALDQIQDAVYLGTAKGDTYFINREAERFNGISRKNVIGKNEEDLFGTRSSRLVSESGKPIESEFISYPMAHGQMKSVLHSVYPYTSDGEIVAIVSISRDVTKENLFSSKLYDLQQELKSKKNRGYKNGTRYTLEDILGTSIPLLHEIRLAERVAKFDTNVMICGETGTGKEMFAQGIHNVSPRHNEPFVGLNCGAVPENLLESMLFGTEKGAFTGAEKSEGLIENAGNGTLFLDELDSMPLAMQAKLLRVLQEKTVRRVGGTKEIPVRCRIISATNMNIDEALAEKRIRSDIYYRLASVTIHIPPLRERKSDILMLAEEFIGRMQNIFGTHLEKISDEVQEVFRNYPWPGNVRELEHTIENAMLVVNGNEKVLQLHHLPEKLSNEYHIVENNKQRLRKERKRMDLEAATADFERHIIMESLQENNGNISATADCLGLYRSTLYRKMERLNIHVDEI